MIHSTLVLLLVLSMSSAAWAMTPGETLQHVFADATRILSDPETEQRPLERFAAAEKLVTDAFDFRSAAELALGRRWPGLAPRERDEFTALFAGLLARSYLSRMATGVDVDGGVKVQSRGETIDGDEAIVRTAMIRRDGGEKLLDYRMIGGDGRWKVRDVVIDGVSVADNYRAQLDRVLGSASVPDLLAQMRAKVGALEPPLRGAPALLASVARARDAEVATDVVVARDEAPALEPTPGRMTAIDPAPAQEPPTTSVPAITMAEPPPRTAPPPLREIAAVRSPEPVEPAASPAVLAQALAAAPASPVVTPAAQVEALAAAPVIPVVAPVARVEALPAAPVVPVVAPVARAEALPAAPVVPVVAPVARVEALPAASAVSVAAPAVRAQALPAAPAVSVVTPAAHVEARLAAPEVPVATPPIPAQALPPAEVAAPIPPPAALASAPPTAYIPALASTPALAQMPSARRPSSSAAQPPASARATFPAARVGAIVHATSPAIVTAATRASDAVRQYWLQIGRFSSVEAAGRLAASFRGGQVVVIAPKDAKAPRKSLLVRIGPFADAAVAVSRLLELQAKGHDPYLVAELD